MCLFKVFSEVTIQKYRYFGGIEWSHEAVNVYPSLCIDNDNDRNNNDNNNDDDVDVDNKVDAGNYRGDDSDHENCKNYTVIDMCWCELNPSLVLWAPLCSKLGEKFHITSTQVIHSTIMKSCSHLQMLINLFHATNTQHTAQEFFFFKLGVNFLRTVTLIDNHVTTAYNNTNNVTMSLHTHM